MAERNPNALGQKIKDLRLKTAMSQKAVAQKIGISQAGYSKLETGRSQLSVHRMVGIAKIYKLSVTELLDDVLE